MAQPGAYGGKMNLSLEQYVPDTVDHGALLTTSLVAHFTNSTGAPVILTSMLVSNTHTAAQTVTLEVLPSGASTNAKYQFVFTVQSGDTEDVLSGTRGVVVANGTVLSLKAGTGATVSVKTSYLKDVTGSNS